VSSYHRVKVLNNEHLVTHPGPRHSGIQRVVRTPSRWAEAMASHERDAHGGRKNPACSACKEMARKANEDFGLIRSA
jgi:hypothetical protein